MRATILPASLLCLVFATFPGSAQSPASNGMVRTHIEGIEIPPVANAPFTARVVVTWDQPLVGGGTVSRVYFTLVARDSRGRVHRETRGFVPANSDADPPLRSFSINDPVTGTRTVCSQSTMSCTSTPFQPRDPQDEGSYGAFGPGAGNVKQVSLGEQFIGSMRAVGTRQTFTTTAGERGSDRLVVNKIESWHSPDLQIDLSVRRSNPQMGLVTLSVTNLLREEPDPSWFAVPSGYEQKDARNK